MKIFCDLNKKTIIITEEQSKGINNLLFEQYLTEATLDDIYSKYYSDIPNDIFWNIIKADPTWSQQNIQKMGKFGKWLLNLYKQNKLKEEDLYKATDYLSYFKKYYNKIEQKDINKIPDLPSLFMVIQPFKTAENNGEEIATSKSDEIRKIKQDAEKFYEDDTWLVVIPHTQEAACYYGKHTQWCTAATDSYNYFNHYNSKGSLYININKKTNKKYQFHFETNSFTDETDNPIACPIAKSIGISNNLLQAYVSKYGAKATILLSQLIDLDNIQIDGQEPYYVYNDYDGYEHIVKINGINITPCKGINDNLTWDNDIRYLCNGIFRFNDYVQGEDDNYNNEEDDISDDYTLYDAKTGKRFVLSEDISNLHKVNDSYFTYSENGKRILLSSYNFSKVFECDVHTRIRSADYFNESFRNKNDNVKFNNYDDEIIILFKYTLDGNYYKVYNLYTQKYIKPPFEKWYLSLENMDDGYRYIVFREMNSKGLNYCLLLSDGSISQVYSRLKAHPL